MGPRQRKGKKKGSSDSEINEQGGYSNASVGVGGGSPSLIPKKTSSSGRPRRGGADQAPPRRWSDRTTAAAILLLAFATYVSDGGYTSGGDVVANIYMPLQILRGKMWWKAYDNPHLFTWKRRLSDGTFVGIFVPTTMDGGHVHHWNRTSTGLTPREMLRRKELFFVSGKYMIVPVVGDTEIFNRRYVNTFNVGTAITFTPVVAALALFYKFDLNALQNDTWLLFHASKVTASFLVAASGSLVFLSSRTFPSVSRTQAASVACAYCFGTCVWSVSSQALWQHGANEFYLSLAIYALTTAMRRRTDGRADGKESSRSFARAMVALCGFGAGMATVTRPTSAIVAVMIGIYLLLMKREWVLSAVYAGVGAVMAAGQLYYNWLCFGNPLEFGQQQASRGIALAKTGSADLWQTPLWKGGATLLLSPSRGLFVFSPLMLFALPGLILVWRPTLRGKIDRPKNWFEEDEGDGKDDFRGANRTKGQQQHCGGNEFEVLRPFMISIVLLWILAFKFFDYWGGWCFGYRPLVDTMPMLAMFLCVVVNEMEKSPPGIKCILLALATWSVAVQFVGATACTNMAWNARAAILATKSDNSTEVFFDWKSAQKLKSLDTGVKFESISLNVDKPEYRYRLWSWSDSQVLYYIQHYKDARKAKPLQMDAFREFG